MRATNISLAGQASLRIVGVWPVVVSLGALIVLLLSNAVDLGLTLPMFEPDRVVASIVPLTIGLQAAFAFSPTDEPPLEILLAMPRRLRWLLLERLGVMAAGQTLVAVIGLAIVAVAYDASHIGQLAEWIAPAVFFTGIAVFVTLTLQQALPSVALTFVTWWVFGFLGDGLIDANVPIWPFKHILPRLWIIHPYLQPDTVSMGKYLLNRATLIAVGVALLALAIRHLENEERLLLGSERRQKEQ